MFDDFWHESKQKKGKDSMDCVVITDNCQKYQRSIYSYEKIQRWEKKFKMSSNPRWYIEMNWWRPMAASLFPNIWL